MTRARRSYRAALRYVLVVLPGVCEPGEGLLTNSVERVPGPPPELPPLARNLRVSFSLASRPARKSASAVGHPPRAPFAVPDEREGQKTRRLVVGIMMRFYLPRPARSCRRGFNPRNLSDPTNPLQPPIHERPRESSAPLQTLHRCRTRRPIATPVSMLRRGRVLAATLPGAAVPFLNPSTALIPPKRTQHGFASSRRRCAEGFELADVERPGVARETLWRRPPSIEPVPGTREQRVSASTSPKPRSGR